MCDEGDHYYSYLLRVWRARELRDTWRVSLESTRTHAVHGFADFAEAFEFLRLSVEGGGELANVPTTEDPIPEEE